MKLNKIYKIIMPEASLIILAITFISVYGL